MVRNGEASRQRLLAAAATEFARYGIAGARVDRIAAAADVNKGQMYGWFGSKDALFDAVFDDQLTRIVDAVPFVADDLPGYAVGLYDSYLTSPELVRLSSWNRLELAPIGALLHDRHDLVRPKLDAIVRSQANGRIIADISPEDVYAFVIALAGTWSPVSGTYTASVLDDHDDHERRRAALHSAVQRALVPAN